MQFYSQKEKLTSDDQLDNLIFLKFTFNLNYLTKIMFLFKTQNGKKKTKWRFQQPGYHKPKFLKCKFWITALTGSKTFKNKQKQQLKHELFVNNKRNKSFFLQLPKKLSWPPFSFILERNNLWSSIVQKEVKNTWSIRQVPYGLSYITNITFFKHKKRK